MSVADRSASEKAKQQGGVWETIKVVVEALLIAQMLRGVRESGGSWLGSEDSSGECATDYAEQQFAAVLAQNGGLGLADIIARGLQTQE